MSKRSKNVVRTFDSKIISRAVIDSFKKLNPKVLYKNPVMFVVEVGWMITTIAWLYDLFHNYFSSTIKIGGAAAVASTSAISFNGQISLWLLFTIIFANFAEAIAEGRGKAQADSLRKARQDTAAKVILPNGTIQTVASSKLKKGDVVQVEAGQIIPGDGTVIKGVALVDESAITGESAPVIREDGGDRSAVTGGTKILSDSLTIKITQEPGQSFLDRMIALVEGAIRQKTPNEIALSILLSGLTIIFLLAVVSLRPFAIYSKVDVSVIILVALLVCLIPTTIGGLLSAIGIAGMDRLVKRNILAMSGRAVEAAGNIDILLLDKTGTITLGNRQAYEFIPVKGASIEELATAACLSSISDFTPEGRSIVELANRKGIKPATPIEAEFIKFTAETQMSGINFRNRVKVKNNPQEYNLALAEKDLFSAYKSHSGSGPETVYESDNKSHDKSDDNSEDENNVIQIRKGATTSILHWLKSIGGTFYPEINQLVSNISNQGGTPLVVANRKQTLGVIYLKDMVKPGISERFTRIRAMGIKTVMITGDNPLTAAAIAKEAGVDDYIAEAKPEDKLKIIRDTQLEGRLVAMTGDGTNDAPALAQSDVGLVMNTGTQSARESGNMIDLDSDPTKIIDVVEIGKELLITRGALTTFSIANDVAKYFAILPAVFAVTYPGLQALNIMKLATPQSAILSAVIFNALIIIILIPLALRGVKYKPESASKLLRHNLFVYGVGGLIAPFIGIKIIDLVITYLGIIF